VREFWRHPGRALLMLIYLPFALIQKATPWRFVNAGGRIGHLALQIDWFLKKRALGSWRGVRGVLFLHNDTHAPNEALLAVWERYIPRISNPILWTLVYPLSRFRMLYMKTYYADQAVPADYPKLARVWDGRPPFLTLSDDMRERGERNLRAMGLPPGAWFVCVHARDNLYSPIDAPHNESRNCDISNYEKAVDEIIARGGWCLRMGEPGAKVLSPRAGVVNYHASPFKSDLMDVFLCANTRFFLGNTSGIACVSVVAGRPCALANMIPYGCCYGFGARDISIVKYMRNGAGHTMRFDDVFKSDMSTLSYSFADVEGLSVVENSPEEIRDLAVEMLDVLDGRIEYTKEDERLQDAFRNLLDERHYSHGASGRIGRGFLRQNAHLLGSGAIISIADKVEAMDVVNSEGA
jgi:putative glycosyltransferase (TIGR04372 family)